MGNSTDLAYEKERFLLQFIDSECIPSNKEYTEQDIHECDEAIAEYEGLLRHEIDLGNTVQISQIRKEIQHEKVEKRNIKRMMKNRMEYALT
jgi:hypothetical protein